MVSLQVVEHALCSLQPYLDAVPDALRDNVQMLFANANIRLVPAANQFLLCWDEVVVWDRWDVWPMGCLCYDFTGLMLVVCGWGAVARGMMG